MGIHTHRNSHMRQCMRLQANMHTHAHPHTHTLGHICMHTRIHTHMHTHAHTHIHTLGHICTHTRTHTHALTHSHMHLLTHARARARTIPHTHTHTPTYTHASCIHSHTCAHADAVCTPQRTLAADAVGPPALLARRDTVCRRFARRHCVCVRTPDNAACDRTLTRTHVHTHTYTTTKHTHTHTRTRTHAQTTPAPIHTLVSSASFSLLAVFLAYLFLFGGWDSGGVLVFLFAFSRECCLRVCRATWAVCTFRGQFRAFLPVSKQLLCLWRSIGMVPGLSLMR